MQNLNSTKGEGLTMVTYHAYPSYTRLRAENTRYGHAMPFFTLLLSCIIPGARIYTGLIAPFGDGNCVPISRGSPPL